jgi:hypothetical protein
MKSKLVALFLVLAGALSMPGQIGRGSITGIAQDPAGAAVPSAAVMATNVATGVNFETTTNGLGSYILSALPVGQYRVTFKAAGFREIVRGNVVLEAGTIARLDPKFEVGAVSEQVLVTAEASMLSTETATNSESVDSNVFADLPLNFGGGRNMAVFADRLVPGVNGSSWSMRINGTPGGSAGVLIDGMTNLAGFLPGDFGEASVSPEAIQELNVFTGNVSSEMGRQAGGTMNFTLKSGSNQPHGALFYYLRNEALSANDWNNNLNLARDPNFTNPNTIRFRRPTDRRKDYGGSFGGPVYIPKVYDGRNKTFFYLTIERFKNNVVGPDSLNKTVPQPEMFQGNLSRLLTNNVVGTDALGRPVRQGQIYDPATLRQVNGSYVADPFEGNIIPTARLSTVAKNYGAIFNKYYQPATSDLTNNMYNTRLTIQDVKQYTIKGDHSFGANHKVSGYYYQHGFPRDFSENASEVYSLSEPTTGGPLSRAIHQERRGHNWSVSHDWVVTPTMLNHLQVGVNWNGNAFRAINRGLGIADQVGIKGVGLGQPKGDITTPLITLGASPVATFQNFGLDANRDEFYRGVIISDSYSWQKGAHSLKFGFEYNNLNFSGDYVNNTGGTFNFAARTTAIPGQSYTAQVGNSFASFLLGQVDSASLGPVYGLDTTRYYAAAFVQDSWKVTNRLTLNYGVRWSGNSNYYEAGDRIANFNPNLIDPKFGIRGAVEYMGSGTGRAGRRTVFPGNWNDWGPTFGLAYRLTDKVVMRGGYGLSFTPEGFGWSAPYQAGFVQTNNVPSRADFVPVFNIDNGFSGTPFGPNYDPSFAATNGGTRYSSDFAKAGYVQNFNFGFQGQVREDLMLEVDWRGSTGVGMHAGGLVRPNQIDPAYLSRGADLNRTISSAADAAAVGVPYPYAGFSGLAGYALLPFPQLRNQGLGAFGDQVGFSTYHSLNFIATKRMSKGLFAYLAYTFSKNLTNVDNVTNGGGSQGLQNTYNLRETKTVAGDDRTHVFKSAFTFDLPFGKGRRLLGNSRGFLNALVGGWNVSASMRHRSGTPMGHPNSRVQPAFWNGPGVWADFVPPSGEFKSIFNPDTFDPINQACVCNRLFNTSVFKDAKPNSLGTTPNRFSSVRAPWDLSEDATIQKNFRVGERVSLQLRFEMINMFNRHYFGGVDLNLNNATFGNIRTANGNRTGQLGARIEF